MDVVYLNGACLPRAEARIDVDDRGFTFGDGVYEVTPVYSGVPLEMERRLDRLRFGLDQLRIGFDPAPVEGIYRELLERNRLIEEPMAAVYLQITRGVAPRSHAFPPRETPPTVYGFARRYERLSSSAWEAGATAVTVPDTRWGRVDIKTLQLLPNAMAHEAARSAGADEAIFVREGIALEGARNNLFVVLDGVLRTHPPSNQILSGISRAVVLDLALEGGYAIEERPTPVEALARASEVFLTGSTTEILPLVKIDGNTIGDGTVGPVTRDLHRAFSSRIERARIGSAA